MTTILRKPNPAHYAPLSDPERLKLYQADMAAWEAQRGNAAPFWNPYTGIAGAYGAVWAEARTWEGKKARVTLSDGTTRQGIVKLTSANAPNGKAGIAVTVFDGYADNWCGAGFLAIEDLTPKPNPEEPEEEKRLRAEYARLDDFRVRERLNWGVRNAPEGDSEVRVAREELAKREEANSYPPCGWEELTEYEKNEAISRGFSRDRGVRYVAKRRYNQDANELSLVRWVA